MNKKQRATDALALLNELQSVLTKIDNVGFITAQIANAFSDIELKLEWLKTFLIEEANEQV